jgi:hypothetical protein
VDVNARVLVLLVLKEKGLAYDAHTFARGIETVLEGRANPMARNFKELGSKMSADARTCSEVKAQTLTREVAFSELYEAVNLPAHRLGSTCCVHRQRL